jgi:hypothetical protein
VPLIGSENSDMAAPRFTVFISYRRTLYQTLYRCGDRSLNPLNLKVFMVFLAGHGMQIGSWYPPPQITPRRSQQ